MEAVLTSLALLMAFFISVLVIPPVLRVAYSKQLFDAPEGRKVHTRIIPPLGGIAIFLGFVLSSIIATDGLSFDELKYIIASVIIVFFIGLKDDLMDISAGKKFLVQIIASLILVILGNVRITSLHGIMGFHEISFPVSFLLSTFVVLVIMNAFNLIDGIDGLASGLGMLAGLFFGVYFYLVDHIPFAIMSFALVGSLAGFFLYNVFGKKNKLFMGDTGSLTIGLVVSALAIRFNEFNIHTDHGFAVHFAPMVSIAVLSVPLIDTLRVMIIRMVQGRSPFSADRNHIHHKILELTPSHLNVTLWILAANSVLIGIAYWMSFSAINRTALLVILFCITVTFSQLPSLLVRWVKKDVAESKKRSRITHAFSHKGAWGK
ncbi:MraY family glycosyltransferase [Maribellus mangrovi]|uniref:MraY family glycosyltransferase n=1 Tax=Maribellus mangrovi TaxID=3133146 RepID=UPI0030EBAAC2